MTVYCVTYDLQSPGQKYAKIDEELRKFPGGRPLETVWLLKSDMTAEQIYNVINKHLDSNDKVMIFAAHSPAMWRGIDATWTKWLQENL
jgi:hypothetical protein